MLYDLRVVLDMPSRRGSIKNVKLRQLKEDIFTGQVVEKMVGPDDYVGVVMLPVFPEPDCVTGASHAHGIEPDGLEWMNFVSNPLRITTKDT